MDKAKLLDDLKNCEGWRPSAYKDSEGYWTLGYGFLIDARKHGQIPKNIAEAWLEQASMERWDGLQKAIPWVASQPEPIQRGLANMAYQMGVDGVLGFHKMLTSLKNHDIADAILEAMDSRWARQTPHRAQFVVNLFQSAKK